MGNHGTIGNKGNRGPRRGNGRPVGVATEHMVTVRCAFEQARRWAAAAVHAGCDSCAEWMRKMADEAANRELK